MERIKRFFNKVFNDSKEMFRKLPVTLVLVFSATLYNLVVCDPVNEIIHSDWIFLTLVLFCFSAAFAESLFPNGWSAKKIIWLGASALSAFFTVIGTFENYLRLFSPARDINVRPEWPAEKMTAYCLIFFILILYCNFKRTGLSFPEYLLRISTRLMQIAIVFFVLLVGMYLLEAAFSILILANEDYRFTFRIFILLTGFYYVPNSLLCILEAKEEAGMFFRVLVKYVLLCMTLAGFGIIYGYMLRILILREIPSNEIFGILTVLFCIGMPVSLMCMAYDRDTLLQKAAYVLPYVYAPFLLLQCYAVGVRIMEYGMTPSRYAGVAMIVFEAVYILLFLKMREKIERLLLVMGGMIMIAVFLPGVNRNSVSRYFQGKVITGYFAGESWKWGERESVRIRGAYSYLSNMKDGEEYLDQIMTPEQKEQIVTLYITSEEREERAVSGYWDVLKELDVTGYGKLYQFTARHSISDKKDLYFEKSEIDLGNLEAKYNHANGNEDSLVLDLRNTVSAYIDQRQEYGDNSYNYTIISDKDFIQTDQDTRVMIESINITYRKNTYEVTDLSIEGYVLRR
ncbi:MAG: DUF4153 domain-containing protein [Lachnospiraceae bacterium]